MFKHISLTILCILLLCAMGINMSGCTIGVQAKDQSVDLTPNSITAIDDLSLQNEKAIDFALRLFRESEISGKNTLISPLSVLYALSMTANGANGDTLKQMEAVLGMSAEELNIYLYSYMKSLPISEKYKLSLANSIWFKDDEGFTVNKDFLQTNTDYYNADIYKAPFNKQTCKDINYWINYKTNGMIPKILDDVPEDAIMYLVNALAFEAEWQEPYKKEKIEQGYFTKEDGTIQPAKFMNSSEEIYLEDEKAIGFMKYYSNEKYAFVAMLPGNGVSVSGYLDYLDGEGLSKLLSSRNKGQVRASIPKFETEYSVEMSEILNHMGIVEAFDRHNANFEKLGSCSDGNLYISRVLHKTFISVAEKGTKAGASTVVEVAKNCMEDPSQTKVIKLDRPFVYMLIDCENNIPFFIGTMMDIEG